MSIEIIKTIVAFAIGLLLVFVGVWVSCGSLAAESQVSKWKDWKSAALITMFILFGVAIIGVGIYLIRTS